MYEKMYTALFNALTDAPRDLDPGDAGAAKARLIEAQRDAENIFMDWEDGEE